LQPEHRRVAAAAQSVTWDGADASTDLGELCVPASTALGLSPPAAEHGPSADEKLALLAGWTRMLSGMNALRSRVLREAATGHDGDGVASLCSAVAQAAQAECAAVEQDPQRVSGAWVFQGTRIPVAALFENLEDGVSLAEFVELFPGVTEKQARLVLEHVARSTAAAVA
jgi:uncharacterized protein (DUF433 family)